jgi:hypothetical protein
VGWVGITSEPRAAALNTMLQGEPCPLCDRPMYYPEQTLDLDHAVPRVLGGGTGTRRLTHSSCNRSAGALLRIMLRRRDGAAQTPRSRRSRQW